MENKKLVVCSKSKKSEDSIYVKCKNCEQFVYLNVSNIGREPVCFDCAIKLIKNNEVNITTFLSEEDIKKFFEFLLDKEE